jgi:hypothetical protein
MRAAILAHAEVLLPGVDGQVVRSFDPPQMGALRLALKSDC